MLNLLREKLHTVRGIEPKYVDLIKKKQYCDVCMQACMYCLLTEIMTRCYPCFNMRLP